MDFSIQTRGLDTIQQKLRGLPIVVRDYVLRYAADYGLQVLREKQAEYRYISRAEAYPDAPAGPGWFSEAQRKKVMGDIRAGKIVIPYQRTGQHANGWEYTVTYGNDANGQVVFGNTSPSAPYVQGFAAQSRHERMVGWRNVRDIVYNFMTFRSSRFKAVVMDGIKEAVARYGG